PGLTAPATTRRDMWNGTGSRLVSGHPPSAPAARPPLQCHREAGRRARHAIDRADLVGHEATDGVERRALDDGDEIERPGHRVEVDDGGRPALDLGELLLHGLGLSRRRLDEHVRPHALPRLRHGRLPQRVSESSAAARVDANHALRSTSVAPSTSTRVPRSSVWLAGSKRATSRVPARSVLSAKGTAPSKRAAYPAGASTVA